MTRRLLMMVLVTSGVTGTIACAADHFRWLESPDSARTESWVGSQEKRLAEALRRSGYRAEMNARLRELLSYDVYGLPVRAGDRVFYTKSGAGGSRTVLYADNDRREPQVVLDVDALFGSDARLGAYIPAPDGRRLALLIRRRQSNWIEARVFDVDASRLMPDELRHIYSFAGRVAWQPGGEGFFYTAFEAPPDDRSAAVTRHARVWYHHLGRPQAEDVQLAGLPYQDGWLYSPQVSDDGRWLIVTAKPGAAQFNDVYLGRPDGSVPAVSRMAADVKAALTFLGATERHLYFYTDHRAERGRVVAIDPERSESSSWSEIVPEQTHPIAARDQTGTNALGMFGDRLVLTYLRDGQPYLRVHGLDGRHVRDVELPTAGSIWGGFSGRQSDPELFYSFMGLAEPGTPYRLRVEQGVPEVFKLSTIRGFDPRTIEVRQEFVTSRDGTSIPMFVAHRRGLPIDGRRRTWIYGYGAMGWVSFLYFQPQVLLWLEQGGIYAQPSLRGGGEYGDSWHRAGSGLNEQNSIDDFVASARWLIDRGYTSPNYLVAHGGSLSAALAGAAMNQHPDLFGAVLIDRPVLDLLRYDRFTGGQYWAAELGSPSEAQARRVLERLSPYHNLRPGTCYPATLVMSGDRDQVAVPAHAYKYVAALQQAQGCDRPVLLKVMRGAGHNFGTSPEAIADSYADALAFLDMVLPASPVPPRPPR